MTPSISTACQKPFLRFRQGFGRLIRTQSDRGVVAVLDKRLITKRYGQVFRDSLPSLYRETRTR
jgi:Rad3-related DNA helicase